MEVQAVISILAGVLAAVISATTIYAMISKTIRKSFKKVVEEENIKQSQELKGEFTKNLQDLAKELNEYKSLKDTNDSLLKDSSLALARDRIHQAYKYYMPKGDIDEHTLYCVVELAKAYVSLGGNTFVKDEVEELRRLHTDSVKLNK